MINVSLITLELSFHLGSFLIIAGVVPVLASLQNRVVYCLQVFPRCKRRAVFGNEI